MSDPSLLTRLIEAEVFKVGEFKLKSGFLSPIYIDLRCIITFPALVGELAAAARKLQLDHEIPANVVCGVPYTALPVASLFSHSCDLPMLMKRKEAKDYGTKKMVEGLIKPGETCLILEDIVTSGSSVIETTQVLRNEGLVVKDCIVILDREQGGRQNLKDAGINLHSLFTVSDFFKQYCSLRKVPSEQISAVEGYLKSNSYIPPTMKLSKSSRPTFGERAQSSKQPIARRLFEICELKKTNLCVGVDVVKSQDLLKLADICGPHICMLKTHVDILSDFTPDLPNKLQALAEKHNFLIMEDRKFADIGQTVVHQYVDGLYRIKDWADVVTVHTVSGPGVLQALEKGAAGSEKACVLIAEMSSQGTLTDSPYKEKSLEMASAHPDFVIGFVGQSCPNKSSSLIHFCPGVSIDSSGDSLGQQYKAPEDAVAQGADIIIVGRGICKAPDVTAAALEYKKRSYDAYVNC